MHFETDSTILFILIISFIATLVRSTFGFGESLVAVPLFSFFIPVEQAVPLSVLISTLVALIVVVQDHRQVQLQSAKWLIIFAAIGIPIGVLILIYGNEQLIKTGLGLLLICYSLYALYGKNSLRLEKDSMPWLFTCGFLSGLLGGAFGINGPPLVVYGNMRRWNARHFRATLQAYFLPASFIGVVSYAVKGLVGWTVLKLFLFSLPAVIPAVFLGRYFNHRLKDDHFFRYVYYGLILIGVLLLAYAAMPA